MSIINHADFCGCTPLVRRRLDIEAVVGSYWDFVNFLREAWAVQRMKKRGARPAALLHC